MREVRLRAFAKINYALDVLGLRGDGYHEVSTVMQNISLTDEVELCRAVGGFDLSLEPGEVEIGPQERNTTYLSWKALQRLTGKELSVKLTLRKEIPAGAGLGGGSANAAAVLVGLNELFGLGLRVDELRGIGAGIGADVPNVCTSFGVARLRAADVSSLPGPNPAQSTANTNAALMPRASQGNRSFRIAHSFLAYRAYEPRVAITISQHSRRAFLMSRQRIPGVPGLRSIIGSP